MYLMKELQPWVVLVVVMVANDSQICNGLSNNVDTAVVNLVFISKKIEYAK